MAVAAESGDGWDGFDGGNPPSSPDPAERDTLDRMFLRCFDTDAGRITLQHLRKQTLDQPVWAAGGGEGWAAFREGQNTIIREIETRMKRAIDL